MHWESGGFRQWEGGSHEAGAEGTDACIFGCTIYMHLILNFQPVIVTQAIGVGRWGSKVRR